MVIFMIMKSKKPVAMITAFALLACMVLSVNLLTVKAAGTVTTGSYTITPSSVFDSDPDVYDNSQEVTIAVKFNSAVTVTSGVESDFHVVLNGTTLTTSSGNVWYRVDPGADSDTVNIVLYSNPANTYPGSQQSSNFFTLVGAQCSIAPTDEDGRLPHILNSSNDPAAWNLDLSSLTLKTGLELNKVDSVAATSSTPASVSYNCSSYALVRGISWLRLAVTNGEAKTYPSFGTIGLGILSNDDGNFFALYCLEFQNGDNNYYLARIYENMTSIYTGFTTNYDITNSSGVLTITQKPGTYIAVDTLSLEVYYSPDMP
jgi:hypothetical protein